MKSLTMFNRVLLIRNAQRISRFSTPSFSTATAGKFTLSPARNVQYSIQSKRMFVTSTGHWEKADVQDLIKNGKDYTLLDVRENAEVAQGAIPSSKHVPVNYVPQVFSMSDADFLDTTGFGKPSKDDLIVTYCKKGMRAAMAAQALHQLGYNNVKVYMGSWDDWNS